MKREVGDYIEDIISAMGKAIDFVKSISYEEFTRDDKTVFAVVRALEIIGEAAKNIPDDIRKNYPLIPWKGREKETKKELMNKIKNQRLAFSERKIRGISPRREMGMGSSQPWLVLSSDQSVLLRSLQPLHYSVVLSLSS